MRDLDGVTAILSLEFPSDRRVAARATAAGAGLFYGFGNFTALAARPDQASVLRMNRLKGRPLRQPGSVTSDPARLQLAFDWARVPRSFEAETLLALMTELHAIGPIGFRGPAAAGIPRHLSVMDGDIRTVQHISPGVRCRSNALVGDVLDMIGEDVLFITSANASSHRTHRPEAAHSEMREVRLEFGHRRDVVLIGHEDEAANRVYYRNHLPCSTSILSFHRDVGEDGRPALLLERHGSLSADYIRAAAARHGYGIAVAPGAHERVPVRWPGDVQQIAA